MEDTIIIQNAVKHVSGLFLVSHGPDDIVQYEDTAGQVIRMGGGVQFFKHSSNFPGKGCENYCLVHELSSEEDIREKLLMRIGHTNTWKPVSHMALEELQERTPIGTSLRTKEGGSLRPVDLMVIQYWIAKRSSNVQPIE